MGINGKGGRGGNVRMRRGQKSRGSGRVKKKYLAHSREFSGIFEKKKPPKLDLFFRIRYGAGEKVLYKSYINNGRGG